MSVSRLIALRTEYEAASPRHPRLNDAQARTLVTAARDDDPSGVTDAEAIVLNQIRDGFSMSPRASRLFREAVADAQGRADIAMRTAQTTAYARTPARAGALHAGGDLPADIDLLMSGLPVTSYAMPESSYAPISSAAERRVVDWRHPAAVDPTTPLGLRVIPVSRATAARDLARLGLVQTGDAILSVRPEWAGTGPYPSAQMGVSHAALGTVRNGRVENLDMPLSPEYVGNLDAPHYRETSMLHIMRPRGLTEAQRTNMREWARLLHDRMADVYPAQLEFNPDYSAQGYHGGRPEIVERLARLALGLPVDGGVTRMYCSEFVWSMLALRNVDPRSAAARRGDFTGLSPLFDPAPLLGSAARDPEHHRGNAGLADGPQLLADLATTTPAARDALVDAMYQEGDMTRMSSGHRETAEKMRPMFEMLRGYMRDANDGGGDLEDKASMANRLVMPNYSPAYYFTNALLPEEERRFDYVGTVVFTD